MLLSAGPAQAQLVPIGECVEVPLSVAGTSVVGIGDGSDCTRAGAEDRARSDARGRARDLIANSCRTQISAAEAAEICANAGGVLPTGGVQLGHPSIPVSGGDPIDRALPISQAAPKICAVLRDGGVVSTSATSDLGCWLTGAGGKNFATVAAHGRCGVQCLNTHQHLIEVRRFTGTGLSGSRADEILADASRILRTDDGVGDVACSVGFSRIGPVTTFATGDGSIDSQSELTAVINLSGKAKVVDEINFCDGMQPTAIGCAPVGSDTFVVQRFDESFEGHLWAHEIGHTRGLRHSTANNALMAGTLAASNTRVTSAECNAFRDTEGNAFGPAVAVQAATLPIADYVRQLFFEGLPYAEVKAYGAGAVPALLAMLADPAEAPHWPNVVAALGILGDVRAIGPMIDFIREGKATRLSRAHHQAKKAAIISLGYLAGTPDGGAALAYLEEGLDPEAWTRRGVSGLGPLHVVSSDRDLAYAKYAVLGLALSGHPKAAAALADLQRSARSGHAALRAREAGLIDAALVEHRKVADKGWAEYHRR